MNDFNHLHHFSDKKLQEMLSHIHNFSKKRYGLQVGKQLQGAQLTLSETQAKISFSIDLNTEKYL